MGGDATIGTVGITGDAPTVGGSMVNGTAVAELTPRLLISVDPSGMPVRAIPPAVMGDVDVGVDDEAMLLDPEPHIPDNPDVSSSPEDVEVPDVADIPEEVGIADVAAVAGVVAPSAIPPPSKLVVELNIDDGAVPTVEHVVPLLGIEIVPVTTPGAGLMPGDAISVEPRGMPVGETVELVPKPSGEVAPIVGVGLAIPVTWATAALQITSGEKTAAINENRTSVLRLPAALPQRARLSMSLAVIPLGANLSDIGQSLSEVHEASEQSAAANIQLLVRRRVQSSWSRAHTPKS